MSDVTWSIRVSIVSILDLKNANTTGCPKKCPQDLNLGIVSMQLMAVGRFTGCHCNPVCTAGFYIRIVCIVAWNFL